MNFHVRTLPKAEADIREIVTYISDRSLSGANNWVDALESAMRRLSEHADEFSEALENDRLKIDVRQLLFKSKHGLMYRLVFTIVDDEARILRVRGPGQAPINPTDVDFN